MSKEKIEELVEVISKVPPIEFPFGSRLRGKSIFALNQIAKHIYEAGYRKQSEIITEFTEAVKHIAEGVKFKNSTEKTAFIEMLEDLAKMKGGAE